MLRVDTKNVRFERPQRLQNYPRDHLSSPTLYRHHTVTAPLRSDILTPFRTSNSIHSPICHPFPRLNNCLHTKNVALVAHLVHNPLGLEHKSLKKKHFQPTSDARHPPHLETPQMAQLRERSVLSIHTYFDNPSNTLTASPPTIPTRLFTPVSNICPTPAFFSHTTKQQRDDNWSRSR